MGYGVSPNPVIVPSKSLDATSATVRKGTRRHLCLGKRLTLSTPAVACHREPLRPLRQGFCSLP